MIGKHADDSTERKMAIAVGYYLDKNSERLKGIPESDIRASVDKYDRFNSFKLNTPIESDRREAI